MLSMVTGLISKNTSKGVTLEIHRVGTGSGKLNLHVFVLQYAQLNIAIAGGDSIQLKLSFPTCSQIFVVQEMIKHVMQLHTAILQV